MKVSEGVSIAGGVSAPVRSKIIQHGRSEQESGASGQGVHIDVAVFDLLPIAGRIIRWRVAIARKQIDFWSQLVVDADAG